MDGRLHAQKGPNYKKREKGTLLVSKHTIKSPDDAESFLLSAALVLVDKGYVFIDKANKDIKLLDNECKIIDIFKLRTRPFDLCVDNRSVSGFYVTEPEAEVVHCFKIHKNKMRILRTMIIDEDCRGITCWKSGLAVSVMLRGFTGTLGILDYDCKIERKTWQTDLGSRLFRAPWYLASTCDGNNIVVSDQGNHSVICIEAFTLDIAFVFKDDCLYGPRSVVCDIHDKIYVLGSSERCHNVVIISKTGKLKDVLLTRNDKLNYPSGLAYNTNNSTILLQTNRDHPIISIYKV